MAERKKLRTYIVKRKAFPFLWIMREKINPDTYHGSATEYQDEKNEEKLRINGRIVAWALVGLGCLVTSVYLKHLGHESYNYKETYSFWETLIRDCSIAIISAALITAIIEVPTFINFMNTRIIESLTNNNYLSFLNEKDLEDIKTKCSRIVFKKKGKKTPAEQYQNESMLEYEAEISKMLLKPYYEYYKMNIHCEDVTLTDSLGNMNMFMKKVTKRHFKIVNPVLNNPPVDLFPPILMHCPENYKIDDLIIIDKIIATVDGNKNSEDISSLVDPVIEDTKDTHPNYNKKVKFVTKGNEECLHPFQDYIIMEIEDTRFVSHSDPFFVTRINKPTKTFSVNYSYNNPDYKLKIEGFNIAANMMNGKIIKVENGNAVSFDILSWMLPGNGIVIATIPIEKTSPGLKVSASGTLTPGGSSDGSKVDETDKKAEFTTKNPASEN